MTKDEIKEQLDKMGIDYKANMKKAELQALLPKEDDAPREADEATEVSSETEKDEVEARGERKATKTSQEVGMFRVFYRELTVSGKRDGGVAHVDFDNEKSAQEFAEEVEGRVRHIV